MKILSLTNGRYKSVVDSELYSKLSLKNWSMQLGYGRRHRRKKDSDVPGSSHWIHLHREVLRLNGVVIPDGMVVDHINRDKLDNRFCNLRVVTRSVNAHNVDDSVKTARTKQVVIATMAAANKPKTLRQLSASSENAKRMNSSGKSIHSGKNSKRSVGVVDVASGFVFETIGDAASSLNVNYSTLRSKLNGTNPNNTTLRTFKWD